MPYLYRSGSPPAKFRRVCQLFASKVLRSGAQPLVQSHALLSSVERTGPDRLIAPHPIARAPDLDALRSASRPHLPPPQLEPSAALCRVAPCRATGQRPPASAKVV